MDDLIQRQAVLEHREILRDEQGTGYQAVKTKYIRQLPPVKPQLCEDVISRREAIKKFTYNYKGQRIPDYDYDNWPVQIDIKTVKEMLRELPSVKPQTGHWIEHPEIETSTPEYLMFYECSECGDKQCFCKSDIHKKHFCNNCGARMSENPTGSDVIWHDKRNYSEIVIEPQEDEDKK